MITVKVLLFATLRERAGKRKFIEVSLDNGSSVSMLKNRVIEEYPALKESMKSVLVTINREYAANESTILEGMEVAMFPPVSGG
jgi:molybdopterin converting factor subunit 1